jgi:hypothetical protein
MSVPPSSGSAPSQAASTYSSSASTPSSAATDITQLTPEQIIESVNVDTDIQAVYQWLTYGQKQAEGCLHCKIDKHQSSPQCINENTHSTRARKVKEFLIKKFPEKHVTDDDVHVFVVTGMDPARPLV